MPTLPEKYQSSQVPPVGQLVKTPADLSKFYVITPISNVARFKRRYALYWKFKTMIERAGVKLITVELALGDRPFMVTERNNSSHVQVRSVEEFWHKENLINIGLNYLGQMDPDAREVAWVDADCFPMTMDPREWFNETWHSLQHYEFVQMWEWLINFGPQGQPISGPQLSFMATYQRMGFEIPADRNLRILEGHSGNIPLGRPGLAWAANISALNKVGGLIDFCILGCYDEQTEVYTKRGFIPFKDLKLDDKVLSLSPDKNVEWGDVTKLYEYDHDGEMYRIKSSSLDMLITPNHKMVFESPTSGNLRFKEIQDIHSHVSVPKVQGWSGSICETPVPCSNLLDWVRFLGIWLSDGHTYLTADNHYRIGITQTKEPNRSMIVELLARTFPHISFNDRDGQIVGSNKELFEYLRAFGKKPERFIPPEIKDLPSLFLREFLEWYVMGDGDIYEMENGKEHVRVCTVSPVMRDDLCEIIIKCGGWCSVTEVKPTPSTLSDGRVITPTLPLYRLYFHRSKSFDLKQKYISKEHYTGKVYCCETPHHTLLVRRNNKMIWCGNSGDWHMAHGLVGAMDQGRYTYETQKLSSYTKKLLDWQEMATRWIKRDVGFVPGTVGHEFHGNKKDRQYGSRGQILIDNKYDPTTDIKYDHQGLIQLETWEPRQIKLRDQIRHYFKTRNEDSIDAE